jgi:hypothetical protein
MLHRRQAITFTISFLDVMCCGFGVMVLLFLVIKHNPATSTTSPVAKPDTASEVTLLEKEILEGKQGLAELRNTIAEIDNRIVTAQGLARRITGELNDTSGKEQALASAAEEVEIEQLKQQLKDLELKRQQIEVETDKTGQDTRSFTGEGNRQYLTGLKLGGKRILVLIDKSASMMDETIVNVIRRRNMSEQSRRTSEKWKQALEMVRWISTRFPVTSQYQIYPFNTTTDSVISGTRGQWLAVSDKKQLNLAITGLDRIVPEGGTSLVNVFSEIGHMNPAPDNIYLITDGLPTQGRNAPRESTISGRNRLELFEEAVNQLPKNIPVNIILLPMEGDPMASGAFWQLAQLSNGSFMSPSRDWP